MSIETLKSLVSKAGGYARSNRFSLSIGPSRASNSVLNEASTFFCESVSIPGKDITTFEYSFNAMRNTVKYANGYTFPDVTCTFNLTNDYRVKKFFDSWLKLIVANDYTIRYASDYERSVVITQLNQQNEQVYQVELLNAFPTSLSSIDLSNSTTDDISKFSVTLTYIDYIIIT